MILRTLFGFYYALILLTEQGPKIVGVLFGSQFISFLPVHTSHLRWRDCTETEFNDQAMC